MNNQIKCNRCGSTEYTKAGFNWRKRGEVALHDVQRFRCKKCGKIFVESNGAEKDDEGVSHGTTRKPAR